MASDMDSIGPYYVVMINTGNEDKGDWWEVGGIFHDYKDDADKELKDILDSLPEYDKPENYRVAEIEIMYKLL
jgi:hypothetical protein